VVTSLRAIPRRELRLLLAALALGLAVRVAYVLATRHLVLGGDEPEYDAEARFIAAGHWFWTALPYGIPHASAWKAPGYPAFLGVLYALIGPHLTAVRLLQALFGVVTIVLTWVLARRLFGARTAVLAAFVVAVYPLVWQFEELLYPESLVTPLTLAALIAILGAPPTPKRAAVTGALVGFAMLVHPTALCLLGGVLVAGWLTIGLRRGTVTTAISIGVALLIVGPWTIRNAVVEHAFIPISLQDAAAYGTFNPDSANDPVFPYAWRPLSPSTRAFYDPAHPLSDAKFRSRLNSFTRRYIRDHPTSLLEAFFWNGLSRLWDIRRQSRALVGVSYEGSDRFLIKAGLDMYYVLLPLALAGLLIARRRRALVLGVIAIALALSVISTVDSGTRYRAPLEPLIVIFAGSALLAGYDRRRARRAAWGSPRQASVASSRPEPLSSRRTEIRGFAKPAPNGM
jgi:4-amino-4-deoxy-L-arabinose transferase-like glycosyltransferase